MSVEVSALQGALHQVRRHVLGIVDGLSEEQLRQPVLPSGWTCVGLVQHLAVDVERFWFRAVMGGEAEAWDFFDAAVGDAWEVDAGTDPASVLALYREEIRRADEVITGLPLDAAPARWPDYFGEFRLDDLREVVLHVVTETACHAGHLDAARELLDGRQWMVLG